MAFTWIKYGKPDVSMTLNGSLAGLVAITAGCDVVDVFGACIIGIVSGFVCCFLVWLLDYKLHVDDPVGAVAVHFGNGIWGTLAVGLFACGTETMPVPAGLFYGGGWHQLGLQALGLLCIGLWTGVTIWLTFFCIKRRSVCVSHRMKRLKAWTRKNTVWTAPMADLSSRPKPHLMRMWKWLFLQMQNSRLWKSGMPFPPGK